MATTITNVQNWLSAPIAAAVAGAIGLVCGLAIGEIANSRSRQAAQERLASLEQEMRTAKGERTQLESQRAEQQKEIERLREQLAASAKVSKDGISPERVERFEDQIVQLSQDNERLRKTIESVEPTGETNNSKARIAGQPTPTARHTDARKVEKAETSDVDVVKAAIRSRAYYPRSIKFAPIEEWTIREGQEQNETVFEGWVEQEDGRRNDFLVVLRNGEIPKGYYRAYDERKPIPSGKIWIKALEIDGQDILTSMPSPGALWVDHRKYEDLYEDWRIERSRHGDSMFFNYATGKIEY